jgi:PII-like signaling protein
VAKCHELGLAGAIVFRGLEGFGASARIYHARSLAISKNAPIMVSVIDTEEKIQKLLPHLDTMIAGGLVASSSVEVIRYSHSARDSRTAP